MTVVNDWVWQFNDSKAICKQTGEGVAVDMVKTGNGLMGGPQDNSMAMYERVIELLQEVMDMERVFADFEKRV